MSRPSFASEVRQQLAELGERLRRGRRERLHAELPDGKEYPDPTPMELPIGYERPLTLQEMLQKQIREVVSAQAAQVGLGTFEEENDFEPEDPDEIMLSGYEVHEYEFVEEPGSPLRDDPDSPLAEPSSSAPRGAEAPSGAVQEPPAGGEQTEPATPGPGPQ